MGLCLFPGDWDVEGPDACFSYREFAAFRRRLASEEGFSLDAMQGFGGEIAWDDVATVLEPLLNHPDDHGRNLTPEECGPILSRLEGFLTEWEASPEPNSECGNQIRELRDLVVVLRVCVQKNVEMCFM
ncbi:hypothetical protein [Streptomyces sp. NPDC012510]|uniref:hypothetical protein n=1 Tax=Streptomyces sp. NPDC012510 TaxID=3364838 RepID=UPI0036EFED5B